MSDDTKKKPVSLSTPQATANLDDVLASLEKQADGSVALKTNAVESSEQAVGALPVEAPVVVTPDPVKETAVTSPIAPEITPITSPFQVEETHIEPSIELKAPIAESLPTPDSVQEQPQMKVDSAVPMAESPIQEPVIATPSVSAPQQRGFLSGFSLTPKFIGAALMVAFIAIGSVGAYVASQAPQGSLDARPQATDCKINYNGTSSFTISGGCTGKITRFNGPTCPTTQTKVDEFDVRNETFSPQPPTGQCQQVDHNFSGTDDAGKAIGHGGVCSCNNVAPPKKSCGESCVSDNDCRNPSTAGIPVVCRGGVCENSACPTGQTQPGANCSCNAGRSCGMSCGASVGLCTDGKSTCGFITPPNQCQANEGNVAKQFCLPLQPSNGYSTVACVGIFTVALVKPNGTAATTQADVQAACAPPVATATPTPRPTATPTPRPTATPTARPTNTPTPTPTSAPLVCVRITSDTPQPVVGSQVRFTCGRITGATSYEFRYKYSFAGVQQNIGTITANDNVSSPLVIGQAATYKVQCRPCVGQSCTPWENW